MQQQTLICLLILICKHLNRVHGIHERCPCNPCKAPRDEGTSRGGKPCVCWTCQPEPPPPPAVAPSLVCSKEAMTPEYTGRIFDWTDSGIAHKGLVRKLNRARMLWFGEIVTNDYGVTYPSAWGNYYKQFQEEKWYTEHPGVRKSVKPVYIELKDVKKQSWVDGVLHTMCPPEETFVLCMIHADCENIEEGGMKSINPLALAALRRAAAGGGRSAMEASAAKRPQYGSTLTEQSYAHGNSYGNEYLSDSVAEFNGVRPRETLWYNNADYWMIFIVATLFGMISLGGICCLCITISMLVGLVIRNMNRYKSQANQESYV